eukprot:g2612.t1
MTKLSGDSSLIRSDLNCTASKFWKSQLESGLASIDEVPSYLLTSKKGSSNVHNSSSFTPSKNSIEYQQQHHVPHTLTSLTNEERLIRRQYGWGTSRHLDQMLLNEILRVKQNRYLEQEVTERITNTGIVRLEGETKKTSTLLISSNTTTATTNDNNDIVILGGDGATTSYNSSRGSRIYRLPQKKNDLYNAHNNNQHHHRTNNSGTVDTCISSLNPSNKSSSKAGHAVVRCQLCNKVRTIDMHKYYPEHGIRKVLPAKFYCFMHPDPTKAFCDYQSTSDFDGEKKTSCDKKSPRRYCNNNKNKTSYSNENQMEEGGFLWIRCENPACRQWRRLHATRVKEASHRYREQQMQLQRQQQAINNTDSNLSQVKNGANRNSDGSRRGEASTSRSSRRRVTRSSRTSTAGRGNDSENSDAPSDQDNANQNDVMNTNDTKEPQKNKLEPPGPCSHSGKGPVALADMDAKGLMMEFAQGEPGGGLVNSTLTMYKSTGGRCATNRGGIEEGNDINENDSNNSEKTATHQHQGANNGSGSGLPNIQQSHSFDESESGARYNRATITGGVLPQKFYCVMNSHFPGLASCGLPSIVRKEEEFIWPNQKRRFVPRTRLQDYDNNLDKEQYDGETFERKEKGGLKRKRDVEKRTRVHQRWPQQRRRLLGGLARKQSVSDPHSLMIDENTKMLSAHLFSKTMNHMLHNDSKRRR